MEAQILALECSSVATNLCKIEAHSLTRRGTPKKIYRLSAANHWIFIAVIVVEEIAPDTALLVDAV